MKSAVTIGLQPKIFKTSLVLILIVFAFTMSYPSSFFQIIKPAEAAGLVDVKIIPTSNIVNERSTYDIFFKTATAGTIKTIEMEFPSGFDVSAATKLIEKGGIDSGSLSALSSSTLLYTVSNPVNVAAGTVIRLEIGRVVNSDTAGGSFKVTITTKNTSGGTIDGPTSSASFPIKDITSSDISPNFMVSETLNDDATGHTHGWDPDSLTYTFLIEGISGITETSTIIAHTNGGDVCVASYAFAGGFKFSCSTTPLDASSLIFTVINTPVSIVASSLPISSSESSSQYESLRAHDQIASEFP